jgi:hypothetical protein
MFIISGINYGNIFTIGFGILIAFGLVCVLQMVGNDLGKGFMMVLW